MDEVRRQGGAVRRLCASCVDEMLSCVLYRCMLICLRHFLGMPVAHNCCMVESRAGLRQAQQLRFVHTHRT